MASEGYQFPDLLHGSKNKETGFFVNRPVAAAALGGMDAGRAAQFALA